MKKRKTGISLLSMAIAVGFVMSSCIKSSTPPPATPAKSYVSILHLAPTAPTLDVFFNDTKVSTNPFTPGSVSAAYNEVEKGDFAIRFKKASSDSVVATVPFAEYDSLRFYTIFIYNLQANGPAEAMRIEDNFAGLNANKTFYRFFHASPNVNSVDLYIDNAKIQSGRSQADNAGQGPLNEFVEASPGFHTFQVKLAGTDSTIASSTSVDLAAGNAYTIYLKGLGGGSGSSGLSLELLRAVN